MGLAGAPALSEKPECDTHGILRMRYLANLRVFIDANSGLESAVGVEAIEAAYSRATHAREAFEHSRNLLLQHRAEHGCGID